MSKVMEPAPVQPPAGQGQPPAVEPPAEPWVLDDSRPPQRWALDETPLERQEQQQQPPAAPGPGQVQQTTGAQAGQGVEYVLPTGHILRAPTWQGIADQLKQGLITLAQQVQQQPQREYNRPAEQPPTPPPPPARAPFDGKRFYSLLAEEKPIEAIHSLMQEYFGVEDPRQIATQVDYAHNHALKMNDRLETADFLSNNPDFPASSQSADLLLSRLDRDAVPVTRWNMEVAYQQLLREGSLQRVAVAQAPPQDYRANYQAPAETPPTQPPPPSRGAGAPPLPGSQGGEIGDRELSDAEFEMLSTADMKKYLDKRGMSV